MVSEIVGPMDQKLGIAMIGVSAHRYFSTGDR
jgi:hypothetical protein